MGAQDLEQPLLDGGVRSVNFFNGRLLTANDLRREQDARHIGDRRLGQAIGAGVAYGLEVRKDGASTVQEPLVTVNAGLAVNREGQALYLKSQISIALVRKATPGAARDGDFGPCGVLNTGTYVAGPGVYLLTIAPARADEGRALTSGFDQYGGKCNTDAVVETVQFRLVAIDVSQLQVTLPEVDVKKESLFRNQLAMLCLGNTAQGDPFAVRAGDPAVLLAGNALSRCDVPLGIIYWTLGDGIRFVDQWAVRRRIWGSEDRTTVALFPHPELRALGEARLLQFTTHLEDLLTPGASTDQYRVEDFFRYLPPAGYFPVRGAGSPQGLSPSGFVGSFTQGLPDRMAAGMVSEILWRSFGFSPIDITDAPCLQLFEVDENAAAVAAGKSKQRLQVFVTRALDGPAADDALCSAFENAWTVYRGVLTHRLFLELGSTPEEMAMQLAITGAVRDVMDIATRQAARAGAWSLDDPRALSALQGLYSVQSDLQVLLASDFPGVTDTQDRGQFATLYLSYLDGPLTGSVALHGALNAKDLRQAIAAQNAVNQFVGRWSGEGIAVGPAYIRFLPGNTNTVPGGAAYAHQFELHNGTDRSLTFGLSATITAPRGDWTGAATIHEIGSATELQRIDIRSGGVPVLEVRVRAPATGPQNGDRVTLTVAAVVGPPNDRNITQDRSLTVTAAQGPAVTNSVVFDGQAVTPSGGISETNIAAGTQLTYRFNVRYDTTDTPAQAQLFDFVVALSTPQPAAWGLVFNGDAPDSPGLPAGSLGKRLTLTAGQTTEVSMDLIVPATGPDAGTFQVSVRSVNLQTQVAELYPSNPAPTTFAVTVI